MTDENWRRTFGNRIIKARLDHGRINAGIIASHNGRQVHSCYLKKDPPQDHGCKVRRCSYRPPNSLCCCCWGELVRQAVQHAEHGFDAVAGQECKRRCAKRADWRTNHLLSSVAIAACEKADRHSKNSAEHQTYDVVAQVARRKETVANVAQIAS